MGELDEKLNAILQDPGAMERIMALARSIAPPGEEGSSPPPSGGREEPGTQEESYDSGEAEQKKDEEGLNLEGLDPQMLQLGLKLMAEYRRQNSRSAALLEALRPYLRPERRARLDKAVQAAKLSRVARVLLEQKGWKKGEHGDV